MIAHIIPCVMEAEILTAIAWALAHAREPRGWSDWCEANVKRITAAIEAEAATHRAATKRPRKVAEPRGQAALFAE